MKVTITAMKAPWPAGAKPGDVLELGAAVPGWALGKCKPAADDAEVTVAFAPPAAPALEPAAGAEPAVDANAAAALAEADAQAAAERATMEAKATSKGKATKV